MKKCILLLLLLGIAGAICSVAQTTQPPPPGEKFGSSAIWTVSPEFLQAAHPACDHGGADKLANCFLAEMVEAGAPDDAVTFTRDLYDRTGEFGVMGAI